MTTPISLESTGNFTINPPDGPQHVSAIVPVSCVAIAVIVFASLGYAYYKDLYVPNNDADPIETADFDFHSRDSLGRRPSILYAQFYLMRLRQGVHSTVHSVGGSILAAGGAVVNWWKRKTRSEEETNTFYMGVNQFKYHKGEDELLLI